MVEKETIWEVFIQSKNGLAHKHVGNVHASDKVMALENARELYTIMYIKILLIFTKNYLLVLIIRLMKRGIIW